MRVTVALPDEVIGGLGSEAEVPRRILGAVILERYLTEDISFGRLAELLGLSRTAAENFLDDHHARLPYTREMLDEDRRNLAGIFGPK
jgi:predicted HTH domain antitoxin